MKKLIAKGFGVVVLAVATASGAMVGAGAAAADPLVGRTYEDASSRISEWNANAVIATVSGNQLPMDKCIVTSWNRGVATNALTGRTGNKVLLNLNCNEKVAQAGVPGNSAATPEGKRAKADIRNAKAINARPERCQRSEELLTWCKRVCERTGLCSIS